MPEFATETPCHATPTGSRPGQEFATQKTVRKADGVRCPDGKIGQLVFVQHPLRVYCSGAPSVGGFGDWATPKQSPAGHFFHLDHSSLYDLPDSFDQPVWYNPYWLFPSVSAEAV
jgi:hypothetical protein